MSDKQRNTTEYLIFSETGVTTISQKIIPLDALVSELNKHGRVLENLAPNQLGALLPLVISTGEFSIAMGLQPSKQGCLIGEGGIEQSARDELIEKIKEAEKKAVSSIKAGNKVARKLHNKIMDIDELNSELQNVEDDSIARNTINYSRFPVLNIDFTGSSQTIGGQLRIPAQLNANKKIKLSKCLVKESVGGGEYEVYSPDIYKTKDKSNPRRDTIRIFCDPTSTTNILVQLAFLFKSSIDIEALVIEQIKDKKRKILVTGFESPEKILQDAEMSITEIKENLLLDF